MKRILTVFLSLVLLTGCAGGNESQGIKVFTRDGSSGTREAFESLIKLENLTPNSAETTGNGDMATQVGQTKDGIGYVSLTTDFEANNLKPIDYKGVTASIETVNDGSYELSRPFSFVTRAKDDYESAEKEQLVLAFIDYLTNSIEGKQVVLASGGIVDVNKAKPWDELKTKHPIVERDNSMIKLKTGGSTSVEKTLKEAVQSFIPLAGNFTFESAHTGSSDGYKRVLGSDKDGANRVDIGFASRTFKSDENVSSAIISGEYCKDAVVVVVNKDNQSVTDLNAEQLVSIFDGTVKNWSEIK